jgi:type II secretory pathway pseudopilin PulG
MRQKTKKFPSDLVSGTGFSMVDLLIAVAVILILATISIPSLFRSHQAENESRAVAEVRTVNSAQITYRSSTGSFGTLSQLINDGVLDSRFSGASSGYSFTITTDGVDYTVSAYPVSSTTGRYGYYSTRDAVIRYSTAASLAPSGQAGNPAVQ